MNYYLRAVKSGFCAAGILIFISVPVRSQVLLYDTFTNGTRLTQNLPSSAHWYSGGLSNNVSVNSSGLVFAGDIGGSTPGSIHGGGLAYFTASGSPYSLAIGQTMTLSFDYSYGQINSADWSFEFGLFNSGGSRVTTDDTSFNSSIFNAYSGYVAAGVLGPDPSGLGRYKIAERNLTANNLLTTSSYTILGSNTIQTAGTNAGVTYDASLTLAYAASGEMILTSDLDGQMLVRTNTSGLVTSFDTVGIFAPGTPGTFTFGNVQVDVTSAPEPSIPELTAIGMLTLLGINIRRRPPNG